jgi:PleD family two-component response regulator
MTKNKATLCTFTAVLSITLLIYIFFISFFEKAYSHDNTFLIKTVFLGVLFIFVTFVLSFFRIYKKRYIEDQIKQRTGEILSENKTLKTHTHIDFLTQCLNEKHFMERFDEEFKRAIREKQNISLIIVNIDEFKAFNDIYGRAEGDECLKLIANILVKHCSRPTDLVARFKGDEFLCIVTKYKRTKSSIK